MMNRNEHEGFGWLVLIPLLLSFGVAAMIVYAMMGAAHAILSNLGNVSFVLH